jgi:GTP-dependent phosphoenolpyruvate carboxykinase
MGLVPDIEDFDTDGLAVPRKHLEKLFEFKPQDWEAEARDIGTYLEKFCRQIPYEIHDHIESLGS